MPRLQDIETRFAAIQTAIVAEGADVTALSTEVNTLITERSGLITQNEQRTAVLNNIANNITPVTVIATPPGVPAGTIPGTPAGAPAGGQPEQRTIGIDTPEYRTAFIHRLQGADLTDAEKRAISSVSVPGALPTQTLDMVMTKLKQVVPLLNKITLFHIAGNITLNVENARAEAELHPENGTVTPASDELIEVKLGGYEIIKLLTISAKTSIMTINAFETWLVDNLVESVGYRVEYYLINGTGSNEPQGAAKAYAVWTDGTNAVAWAGAALAAADITEGIALLPGVYDTDAVFLMKKTTFWNSVMPIRDDAKAPIVQSQNGKYYIFGYEVMLSDYVTNGHIYLGNFKKILGNFGQDITFASSNESGFRSNSVDYRGVCIFDSKVAIPEAFVKIAAAV